MLRFSPEAGTWALPGDAAEYNHGETRRQTLETVRAYASLTPKQTEEVTEVGYELVKKSMQRMASDGRLIGDRGSYRLSPQNDVPSVPLSPKDGLPGTKGQEGHVCKGEEER